MAIPEFDLEGGVGVVTGGGRSIGRAVACALAEAGADVALAGRHLEALERVAAEVEDRGRRALPVRCDISRPEDVSALFDRCLGELGPPNAVVANAGIFQQWGATEELDDDEWREVIDVDLSGTLFTCRAAGRIMVEHGGGSIVVVSSIAGLVALPRAAAYTAAKFGVEGLTRALAAEWAPRGVRVNAVAPGFILRDDDPLAKQPETLEWICDRTPLGRLGMPREAALAAVFLVSPAATYITGATLAVDGGWVAVSGREDPGNRVDRMVTMIRATAVARRRWSASTPPGVMPENPQKGPANPRCADRTLNQDSGAHDHAPGIGRLCTKAVRSAELERC
jgi:NAD(P)-dependent dehydrogenase (short-subunit alcohol dehydrogenase family)